MGGVHSTTFIEIERKYGSQTADYIVKKHTERIFFERTRDEVQRINDHVNLQESEDLEWINQQRRELEAALEKATADAESHKKGLISESQARNKKSVRQFSGYNEELKRLNELENKVKEQYKVEKEKASSKVDQEVRKGSSIGGLKAIPEFDSQSNDAKRRIEEECFKRYPAKKVNVNTGDVERNLRWDKFKDGFTGILVREQVGKQNEEGRNRVRNNVVPAQAPVCC